MNLIPITYPLGKESIKLYEEIDKIRVEGMHLAERKCRRFKTGKIPWSPAISAAQNVIELWTLVARRCKGCKVNTRTILRQKKKAGIEADTDVNYEVACSQLTAAYKVYIAAIKDSAESRVTFLQDLAKAKAADGKVKEATILK